MPLRILASALPQRLILIGFVAGSQVTDAGLAPLSGVKNCGSSISPLPRSRTPVTVQGRTPRDEPFQRGPFRGHQVDPVGTFLSSFHGLRQHKISS
jgi:hypothetical protein